jgi:Uma2 family endonuclease
MPIKKRLIGEPCWEIAQYLPMQGRWTEDDYEVLEPLLPSSGMMELSNGFLEFRKKASERKKEWWISLVLVRAFSSFSESLGISRNSDLAIWLCKGTIRVPDAVFVNRKRKKTAHWYLGADLVVEVLGESREEQKKDWVTKRAEYAKAGIKEYWVVDPRSKAVTVFTLPKARKRYEVHGKFGIGQKADSVLLDGFEIEVKDIFKRTKR